MRRVSGGFAAHSDDSPGREKVLPELPLTMSRSLESASVRLMIVKKNVSVLRRLITDLLAIRTPLAEIPTLIVDAEPSSWTGETGLNRVTSRLFSILPRAQYVAYSPGPLTDLMVDPTHAGALYPRDFIVSLPRPAGFEEDLAGLRLPETAGPRECGPTNLRRPGDGGVHTVFHDPNSVGRSRQRMPVLYR